jgi:type II secretory ATPase GspE/PulE/Tfp pilus assembly ATPase PilB-like protein
MSDTIGRLVLERQPTQVIEKQAVKEGMLTLMQDGFMKVLEGITTVEEVMRVAESEAKT